MECLVGITILDLVLLIVLTVALTIVITTIFVAKKIYGD